MKKTKALHRSAIKQLPYPGHAVDRETVAELSMSLTHGDIRVREAASLSISTLLINTENVESFYRTGSVNSIIRSLKNTELTPSSMKHISMSIASLNILVESDMRLRHELLASANSIEVLFHLCRFMVHHDPNLQLYCFQIIQALLEMDNSIQDFAKAKIVKYLVSSELLTDPKTHKKVTRGASDLVYKLLLFDSGSIRVKDIEDVCFIDIESGAAAFHDDITENTIFHAVNYALSVKPQPAVRVLLYCVYSIRAEKILDTAHLLLLLRCIHGAVELDWVHSNQALEHGAFHCLIYASSSAYWRVWLVDYIFSHQKALSLNEAALSMKGAMFERPSMFPEMNNVVLVQCLYPKLMEILDEVVSIYIEICIKCPKVITSVCSSGIIDSLLSNPTHLSPVNSKEYPSCCVVGLVSKLLVVALENYPSESHRYTPFLKFMLPPTVGRSISSMEVKIVPMRDESTTSELDFRLLTSILDAQGVIILIMDALQSNKYYENFDEVISAIAVLYPYLRSGVVSDATVIFLSSVAMQSRKIFFPSVAIIIMVITPQFFTLSKLYDSI